MKKILILILLFTSIFTTAATAADEPYISKANKYPPFVFDWNYPKDKITDSILHNPVFLTDAVSLSYSLSSISNIRCQSFHPLDPSHKNKTIDLITDIEYDSINNVYVYECSKYFMHTEEGIITDFEFMYRISQSGPIDSADWIDQSMLEKEMSEITFYGSEVQESLESAKTAAYDAMMYGSSDLSSYLTSVFTIDTDTINLAQSQKYNKVVLNDGIEMNEIPVSSHIGALFKFLVSMQTHYNQITAYIILFAVLSLISGSFFYMLKYKKGKADEEFELKKFAAYFLAGLILFTPTPNTFSLEDDEEMIYTNIASRAISTIYQSLTSVANAESYIAVEAIIDNTFQNAGFASEQTVKQAVKDKFLLEQKIKFWENIERQCQETYNFLDRSVEQYKNRSYHLNKLDNNTSHVNLVGIYRSTYDTLYTDASLKEGAVRGISKYYCTKIIHDLPSIKSKLTLVKDGIELYKSSDWKNNERVLTLAKQIYKDLKNDGFIGFPNILMKIIILQQEAKFDIVRKNHVKEITSATKELIERSSTMDRMAQTVATYVPFLLMPGSDTVLSVASSTGIPIVSSVGGVTLAVAYGQQFLKQLPIYVLYVISMIAIMVYYIIMLLYSILPYVLLAVIFFPKNYLIISKFFKTIVIHAFKSPIIVLCVFISYVISDFITNFAITKNSDMYMQNHDLLEGALTDVPFSQTLLFSMMNVLAVILSAVSIYLAITKGPSIIYNLIMPDKDQNVADAEQTEKIIEDKLKSKGV